ncbi:MAG: hypothetical protein U0893_12990 [Chloroflexota bacterium]
MRVRIYPTLGKEAETRAFMTEWVKAAQAQGEKVGLAARVYSSEGSMLMVPRRFADLAAADARRRENLADAEWQGRIAKLGTLTREPFRQSIEETVVPPEAADPSSVGIVQRAFFYPASDKVGQVRSALEAFVHDAHAAGSRRVGLTQQIFSESGPLLVVTALRADMAELEMARKERAEPVGALVRAVSPLLRAPIAVRLLEVVVPLPN